MPDGFLSMSGVKPDLQRIQNGMQQTSAYSFARTSRDRKSDSFAAPPSRWSRIRMPWLNAFFGGHNLTGFFGPVFTLAAILLIVHSVMIRTFDRCFAAGAILTMIIYLPPNNCRGLTPATTGSVHCSRAKHRNAARNRGLGLSIVTTRPLVAPRNEDVRPETAGKTFHQTVRAFLSHHNSTVLL